WAPKGLSATVIGEKHRSERYSLLPAYRMEGFFLDDPLIVKGSATGELSVDWLNILCVAPDEEDRSVLIIDNCSTHRIEASIRLILG
ncbi:hypothetical protein V8E54_003130, partial [Elaphomyces granulatus]